MDGGLANTLAQVKRASSQQVCAQWISECVKLPMTDTASRFHKKGRWPGVLEMPANGPRATTRGCARDN